LIKFNQSQALLSLTFPTLFLLVEADFVLPRERTVTYPDYIKHLMRFEDGRFTRYPRF
jgi:hypothetical protein